MKQTQSTKCVQNLRQLGLGLRVYAQDHNNRLPAIWYQNNAGYLWYWSSDLNNYLGPQGPARVGLGMCPAWDGTRRNGIAGNLIYVPQSYDSYTYCYPSPPSYGQTNTDTPSILKYQNLASTMLICDSKPNSPSYDAYAVLPITRTVSRFLTQNANGPTGTTSPTGFRHNGKMNTCFADGHVAALSPSDMTTLMNGTNSMIPQ